MSENDRLTEERIFDAATEVFMDAGMDGARMQAIADKAGINKALLHYYYRTKDQLFEAVFTMIVRKTFKKFSPVFDESLSLEEKIRFFFREHITFLQENPKLPAFILNEINRNPSRIKKLLKNLNLEKSWEGLYLMHQKEFTELNISREDLPQFLVSIASISVFPFAARGILDVLLGGSGMNFNDFIEKRKDFAGTFLVNAMAGMKKKA